uniref:Uncharacterized protein n=1 Tax=Anguilla anguilla TaxID=7936 RepID=A0A0E9P8C1_ANGAN
MLLLSPKLITQSCLEREGSAFQCKPLDPVTFILSRLGVQVVTSSNLPF